MKILGIYHGYPPYHNSGAEYMVKSMTDWLRKQGHTVDIHIPPAWGTYDLSVNNPDYGSYDVIISHLNASGYAYNISVAYKIPYVHIVHNDNPNGAIIYRSKGVYMAYNTEALRTAFRHIKHPSTVIHPPVFKDDYLVKGRRKPEYVTLINCNKNKGGQFLRQLAHEMPDTKFLAVRGAYGDQFMDFPDNVEVMDTQKDIKKVYRKTNVLIVPSVYETYGRVAIEAMVNGIPVIATKIQGLMEACGNAAFYVDNPRSVSCWSNAIKAVQADREKWVEKCKLHYDSLDYDAEMREFELFLHDIISNKWKHNL